MENLNNNMTETEEKAYEVEGYDPCSTAAHRCRHDCLGGGAGWTSAN